METNTRCPRTFDDAPLAFKFKLINEKFTAIWNAELVSCGITFSQFPVLMHLIRNQDHRVNQKELCEAVRVKHPTMIGLLERLEEKGLVVRRRDDENHRFINVELTQKGRNLMESFREGRTRSDREAVRGLSDAEMEEFNRMLIIVYHNLDGELKSRQEQDGSRDAALKR